ncbi:MAG: sugar transferase [Anaerolineales bacterium]
MSSSAQRADLYVPSGVWAVMASKLSKGAGWRLYRITLILNDALGIVLGLRLAYWIRFELTFAFFQLDANPSPPLYSSLTLALIPIWLTIFAATGLYRRKNLLGGTLEYELVFRATTLGMMVVVIAGFLAPGFVIARGWLLLAWLVTFLLTAAGRYWIRRPIYGMRRRGYFRRRTLIAGCNEEAQLMARQLELWRSSGMEVIGAVGDHEGVDGTLTVLGRLDQLDEIVQRYDVGELVLATSAMSREEMLTIFQKYGMSDRPNLRLSSGLFEIITTGLNVQEFGYVPLVSVNKVRLTGSDRALKLMSDYALAIPGLILISPLLLIIAILVKLDSPGPVIHRRRVMGVNGIQFDAYKFRTMFIDGDKLLNKKSELLAIFNENHKLKNDPRVTTIGKFIRRFSLDELPQLFNVLKREMSIVGPRMISPDEMPKYEQWGINLLTVHPGITGLWQVSGRSDVSYVDRVRMDMYYVRNWSLWLDIQLLVQTIPAVLKARGAY